MRRDAFLAAAFFAASVAELLIRGEESFALQTIVSAVVTGSLALRRRSLALALGLQCAAFLALSMAGQEPAAGASLPPLLIILFTVGATWPLRSALIGLGCALVGIFISSLVDEGTGDALYVTSVFVIPPWVAGRLYSGRRAQIEQLERLNAELAEERARAEALAAEAERVRIARELHDVLSHGLSLMVLQAGAGPRLLGQDADAARETFRSIRRTGERARQELDAALAGSERGLDLAELVAAVPGARLQMAGDLRDAAPGVRLAVQRIVQESLTNAVKHGGGQVRVDIACDDADIDVTVRDEGGAANGSKGSGRGLIGMRERVAAYGGTLSARPLDQGGFEVRARIPTHPA